MSEFFTAFKQGFCQDLAYGFNLYDIPLDRGVKENIGSLAKESLKKFFCFPFNALIFSVNTLAIGVFNLITFQIKPLGVFLKERYKFYVMR